MSVVILTQGSFIADDDDEDEEEDEEEEKSISAVTKLSEFSIIRLT